MEQLYRADIVREHSDIACSEELDYSEDFYFNLSFIRYAERFYALSTPIYNYVQNPESLVHNLNPVKVLTTRWELLTYYKAPVPGPGAVRGQQVPSEPVFLRHCRKLTFSVYKQEAVPLCGGGLVFSRGYSG